MTTLDSVEKLALELPEHQRAALASHMLRSLPGISFELDEGVVEAQRRDAEIDSNPFIALSLEEFDQKISSRRIR